MKKFFVVTILSFWFFSGSVYSAGQLTADSSMVHLRKNLINIILKNKPKDASIASILLLIQPDGSFSDINYSDRTRGEWPLRNHLNRLMAMTVSWKSPQSSYYNTPKLKKLIFRALNNWLLNASQCHWG